ncbi:MAG: hypothetical protein IJD33_02420 [Clostridia bacterium]|nr:hypothetical protein [Clostridia bacterium]
MKKRMKGILAMSLTATACGALALAAPAMQETQRAGATATNYTNVFAMADGASIRYQNTAGKPQGIRFIVTVSDDVLQNEIMDNYFGFVVHREDKFDDVADNHYANMEGGMKSELVQITEANVGEYFYEGEDEYEGLWCANVVINQGENTDTDEGFMERTYSAVAYYTSESAISDNVASYTYTTNRQERSVQQVASMLYMAGDSDWASVKEVYAVGTESTPMLVAQSGDNAYSKLVEMVNAGTVDSTLKFALGENVVVEEKLPDTFTNLVASDKTAYDSATFYTVNHAVTEVYSTNAAIDLTDKVSAEFGTVTYAVKNSKGVAVPVENNAFTTDAAGKYTVTAKVDGYLDTAFEVEVADNKYADGLILDGTSTDDLLLSTTSKNATTGVWEDSSTVEMSASFDENMKYDSESNGSYKIEYKMKDGVATATNGALMKLAIAPTFSKAYYEGLQAAGYTKIAVRCYMELNSVGGSTGMYYIEPSTATSEMQIFVDNETPVNKSSTYMMWKSELAKAANTWAEMVLDIDKFINNYGTVENLLILSVSANEAVDMTLYIDNVYAVQSAVMNSAVDYTEKNTLVSTNTSENESSITTISFNGEQITPTITDNQFTATQSGTYKVKETERNTYGGTINTVHVFADDYTMGDIVAYDVSNFSAHNNKSNSSDFTCTKETDGIKVTANEAAQSATAPNVTTYKVNTLYDKTYYEWLKSEDYEYITYECRLDYDISYSTGSTLMCRWAYSSVAPTNYTNDSATHGKTTFNQWWRVSTTTTVTANDSTNKKSSYRPWSADTAVKGQTFIISFSIDDYINTYSSTMNIASFFFNNAAKFDYSVTFGKIAATKEACKF